MKAQQEPQMIWTGKKEHAKKMAEWWDERISGQPCCLAHNETGAPTFKAVRCKDGWRVRQTRHFYYGTFFAGHMLLDGEWTRYLTPHECEMYMEPHAGAIGIYEDWNRWEEVDQDGNIINYCQVNAVDQGEVEPVEWDGEKWVEWAP